MMANAAHPTIGSHLHFQSIQMAARSMLFLKILNMKNRQESGRITEIKKNK